MQASIGRLFVAAVVASGDVASLLKYGSCKHLFTPHELDVYDFVAEFAKKHGTLPTAATIKAHTEEELPPPKEPASYYFDFLSLRYIEIELKKGLKSAADHLGVKNNDPQQALAIATDLVARLKRAEMGEQVHDFRQAYDLIIPTYVSHFSDAGSDGIKTGWPTLDEMTGGLGIGDVLSIVGRPSQGKTWQLLYSGHHAWREQGACVLFVSMEMSKLSIEQRLAAMEARVSASGVKNGYLSSTGLGKLKGSLIEIKNAKSAFWVADGNLTTTVDDIDMLASHLKPDMIAIDGAYLLKHPTERDRYRRAAENVELIKQRLASRCPTSASWQFAKSGSKKNKKKGEKTDLDDIGYTDAIAQISTIVLGLLEIESVETMKARVVDILKGRNGEIGKFKTGWDFQNSDFSEVIEEPIEMLQFV